MTVAVVVLGAYGLAAELKLVSNFQKLIHIFSPCLSLPAAETVFSNK